MKQEHILYISNLDDLSFFDKQQFKRIYFGNECCENCFPSEKDIQKLLGFCHENAVPCSIVIPWVTNTLLARLPKIFSSLPERTEIIFNDWGVLPLIRSHGHIPALGRLLVSIKRDPRDIPPQLKAQSRVSNLDQPAFLSFLKKNKIQRIELDNVQQGYSATLPAPFRTSLYYPYVYVSVTRKCIFSENRMNSASLQRDYTCRQECSTADTNRLPLDDSSMEVLLKGNALFYVQDKPSLQTAQLHMTRLVYMPRPPVGGRYLTNEWNRFYETHTDNAPWGYDIPDIHIVEFINSLGIPKKRGTQRALDAGCGHGKNSVLLSKKGYAVFGIDLAKEAIACCKKRVPTGTFCTGTATRLPFPASHFNIIIDAGLLHTNPAHDRKEILDEYSRTLKNGGRLFLRLFQRPKAHPALRPIFYIEKKTPVWGITLPELRTLLDDTLTIEHQELCKEYGPHGCLFVYLKKGTVKRSVTFASPSRKKGT